MRIKKIRDIISTQNKYSILFIHLKRKIHKYIKILLVIKIMEKILYIVTSDGSYKYQIIETNGKYIVYKLVESTIYTDFFGKNEPKVGESRNLDDAITIAKHHAPGAFRVFQFL